MVRKVFTLLPFLFLLFTLTSCGTKESSQSDFTSATEWGNMDIRYGTEWNDNAPGMYYGMKSQFTSWETLEKKVSGWVIKKGRLYLGGTEPETSAPEDIKGILIIPDKITRIDKDVFSYCSLLTNITLPNRLSYIGDEAFCQCGTDNLAIPDTVEFIGRNAFEGIEHIEYYGKATYPPDNKYWGALSMN